MSIARCTTTAKQMEQVKPLSSMPNVPALLFARGYVAWIYPPHQAPSTAQSLAKAASTTKEKANSPSSKHNKNMEIDNIYNMDCLEGMKNIPDGSIDESK